MLKESITERDDTKYNTDVNFAVDVPLPIKGMGINFMPSWWHRLSFSIGDCDVDMPESHLMEIFECVRSIKK